MSEKHATNGATTLDSSPGPVAEQAGSGEVSKPGFIRRYRLPLFLAVVAVCLYAGSLVYIIYVRGQVA